LHPVSTYTLVKACLEGINFFFHERTDQTAGQPHSRFVSLYNPALAGNARVSMCGGNALHFISETVQFESQKKHWSPLPGCFVPRRKKWR